MKAPSNLEDVAFWRVVDLAPLVKSRAVSSTDLTKMYLARMQKYSPKLLCLITATEELALQQAAAADQEIRAGHYRGPLHGIPFGLKDLFDTKGILTTFGAEPYQTRVAGQGRHRGGTPAQRGRRADRQALDGRAGAGRPVVQGHDEDAVEHRADLERIERRLGCIHRRGPGGLLAGHRDAGLDHFAQPGMRNRRTAAHLRPHQPLRRDGAELDDGQNRARSAAAWKIARSCSTRSTARTAAIAPWAPTPSTGSRASRSPACASAFSKRISTAHRESRRRSTTRRIDDLTKAGVKMTPMEFVEDGPTIRFLLERRSRGGLRRHHPRRPGAQSARPESPATGRIPSAPRA